MEQRQPTRSYISRRAGLVSPAFALLMFAAVMSMGARRCEREHCRPGDRSGECTPKGCEQDGEHFDVGESFPSSDGCNTCNCSGDGQIACTLRFCVPDGGVAQGCDYNGTHHDVGASFPSDDGCNTCSCREDGSVGCTKRACQPGGTCGGLIGGGCPAGEYCSFPEGAFCGAADATGTCAKIPEVCSYIYQPVCGCDDKTYGNACTAGAAGVSVASQGECADAGTGSGTCKLGETEFSDGELVICPDGCNDCQCDAQHGAWRRTLVVCEPLPEIERCDGPPGANSQLSVKPLYLDDDALALSVQYGGGCFPHTFKLCYSDAFAESLPVQAKLWLVDTTGKSDACLALPTEQRVFDLGPLRERYVSQYPSGPNTLTLSFASTSVTYSF